MRLATWNINGLRARMEFLALWLKSREPDVVGLQELKTPTEDFPHEFFAGLGYHALVHGQKSWNGVAILTRKPAELLVTGLAGEADMGARLITAKLEEGLEFTTVYCPNGKSVTHEDYARKLAWYDSLADHLKQHPSEQRVLCGDFNIVPEPGDSWRGDKADGEVFHTDDERARLRKVLATGLVDLYRAQNPDERTFTWWDYRGGSFHRNHGLRIDFILTSPGIAETCQETVVDRDFRKKQDGLTASDHAPVMADLAEG